MAASGGQKSAVVLPKSSRLLVDVLDEVFDRATSLVGKAFLVVLGKPLQRWVSADVELRALA